ncbi:MAG: GNAT family N-acetyltransferase [Rhizobiales bacterium]|nr:GNAT family N-acetyltransferase [Hyphomicrobiales bacterium]
MVAEIASESPVIRRLWPTDQDQISIHFSRLNDQARRLRFGGAVSDEFVEQYAGRLNQLGSVLYGAFPDGELRALGELRGLLDDWPATAEAAFSVQEPWQDQGLGAALMDRVVAAAQNRGVKSLHMICLRENEKMRHLALKHDAILHFNRYEIDAELERPWPTPFSLAEEIADDARGFVQAILRWPGVSTQGA